MNPEMLSVVFAKGFRVGAGRGGLKAKGDDVMLLVADGVCSAAGVFTTNRLSAAPVRHSRTVLAGGHARAVVANAGNANAATGEGGLKDAEAMCKLAAEAVGCSADEVLVASTGVIGEALDMEKIRAGIAVAAGNLSSGEAAAEAAARAIMTTDTRPKAALREIEIGGRGVRIGGIAKGAGMISPRMATMLAFITTDAAIAPALLQRALSTAADASFNRVTVDGDMSTNDTVFVLASGMSGANGLTEGSPELGRFTDCLLEVCLDLARAIAADGEGATKFVEVRIRGAASNEAALLQARAIANSPLVKTALFGCDPNWGRVLAAAGYAGAPFDEQKAVLRFNGVKSFEKGCVIADTGELAEAMQAREIVIELDLGIADAEAVIYTCDFSYDYVRINAQYHT
ncbi:MAG: bifunctional glutamate N-acetyltransferase/amino-acid acetyltransferase ArgJ [Planctomycetes bacterium]|nr:bifunctional glutamate N-acetyltransferase/amino-acid acetyltransferase ArgJ [Planctomycetota bacterium]